MNNSLFNFGIYQNPKGFVKMDIPQEFRFLQSVVILKKIVIKVIHTFPFQRKVADSKRSDILEKMGPL